MNTAQTEPMSREAEDAALKVLTNQLADLAERAPTHRLMLLALLSTYRSVAEVHPCCTRVAAEAALQVGGQLLVRSLGQVPTGPLH